MAIFRLILRMTNVSNKSFRENQNINFIFSNFFRKSCRLSDNVEKYDEATEVADGYMAAHCILDK
jgi:hypothetical protein